MKTSAIKTIALGCLGGALGTLLPSCVESYTQDYGSPYGATAYRPGYEVRVLPPDYRTEVINGSTYYHHRGVYYRPRAGGYVIVDPPHSRYGSHRRGYDSYSRRDLPSDGAVVPRPPSGSRMIDTRNGRYYQYNDTYYQQRGSGYAIVGRPY